MRIEIVVETPPGEAISGRVVVEDNVTQFEGWMELLQALDVLTRA
jgi:hypothetical protein